MKINKELISFKNCRFRSESGQSLIEVLIGLAIGALIIGAASMALVFILRSGKTIQNINTATKLTQELLNRAQSFALTNWWDFYSLNRSASSSYFFVSSSSKFLPILGKEVILEKEVKNGLVGLWGFNEATGTIAYDYSGRLNDGVFASSGVTRVSGCPFFSCILSDGINGSVNLGDKSDYNSNDFSVSLWLKPANLKTNISGPNGNIFLGRESYLNAGFRMGISGTTPVGKVSFWTTQSGGTLSIDSGNFLLSTTTNSFYHIVVTYSSSEGRGKMYINGTLVGSGTGTYIVPTGRSLFINGGVGGVEFLNGYFDEVRWFNRALEESEVKSLYTSSHYRRYFYVSDICRGYNYSASSSILDSLPCSGGYFNDPSTKKIVAETEWDADGKTTSFSLSNYVTNWRNFVFNQTDWTGGASPSAVYASPSNQYSSASNITTTPFGSIQIQNLAQ